MEFSMIVANMATFPAREEILKGAIFKLSPQVDALNVVLNEFSLIPEWIKEYKNVNVRIPDQDHKDIGKFLPEVAGDDVVLLVDDDLHYPEDYVKNMIHAANESGVLEGCGGFGGLHGTVYTKISDGITPRLLARTVLNLHLRVGTLRQTYNYWDGLSVATRVDQIGTGTAIFPGRLMPPFEFMRSGQRRADVRLARWAFEKQIPVICLPRPDRWLLGAEHDLTIYESYTARMPKELSNEIKSFAFKTPGRGKEWCG